MYYNPPKLAAQTSTAALSFMRPGHLLNGTVYYYIISTWCFLAFLEVFTLEFNNVLSLLVFIHDLNLLLRPMYMYITTPS